MAAKPKPKLRRVKAKLRQGSVTVPAWILDSGRPGECMLLTAAQHGNEVQGSEAIRRFVETYGPKISHGRLIAVPFTNLPAVRERRPHIRMGPEQSYGDARGHNMNRTWPGRASGNDTARVSHAIYEAFGDEATCALDLHTWERCVAPAVLIRDLPDVRKIARGLGHRFVGVGPLDSKSSTIAAHFCRTGRLGVTYEFSGQYAVTDEQVRTGLRVVVNFAKQVGLLRGALLKATGPVLFSDECRTAAAKAPATGLFVEEAPLAPLARVKKGQLLGRVISDRDLSVREVRSPAAGYLRHYGAMRPDADVALKDLHPYVEKGERVAVVQWKKPARRRR